MSLEDSRPRQLASAAASGHDELCPLNILAPGAVAAGAAATYLEDPEALLTDARARFLPPLRAGEPAHSLDKLQDPLLKKPRGNRGR